MIWNKATNSLDTNSIQRVLIQNRIYSICYYFEYIESHFENDLKSIDTKLQEKLIEFKKLNLDPEEYEHNQMIYEYETLEREFIEIKNDFISNYRNSVVFQLFSLVESELRSYCKGLSDKYYFKFEDIRGNSEFEKFKLFVNRTKIIDFGLLNISWEFLDKLKTIRNIITHNESRFTTDNNDSKKIIDFSKGNFALKNLGTISNFENGKFVATKTEQFEVVIDNPQFIRLSISNIENFFDILYNSKRRHF